MKIYFATKIVKVRLEKKKMFVAAGQIKKQEGGQRHTIDWLPLFPPHRHEEQYKKLGK